MTLKTVAFFKLWFRSGVQATIWPWRAAWIGKYGWRAAKNSFILKFYFQL